MRWSAYGAVALLAALTLTGAPTPEPRVTLDRAEARPGEQVLVRLTGWPAGTVVIELCDTGTPSRCAVDTSAQIHLPDTGAGGTPLTVAAPPDGCPCQVRVRTMEGRLSATAPLRVTGATRRPGGTVRSVATRPPVVVGAHVERDGGWPALFGASAQRTVVLRLRNDESAPVAVALSFSVGRGPEPTGFVASPDVPDLAAGEERVVRIPISLPAPAVGDYRIHGELVTSGSARRVEATTDHQPWGLAGLLALAVLVPVVAELRRRRSSGR
ncbi:hypothetical protein ACIBMZ_14995 [Micromonospora sp. NPDC049900]|uniref:hypothetical protein n=1 Tax=Micromonospora sp. NPDC049900 TaxID=3364275 RepID=UPI00379CB82F